MLVFLPFWKNERFAYSLLLKSARQRQHSSSPPTITFDQYLFQSRCFTIIIHPRFQCLLRDFFWSALSVLPFSQRLNRHTENLRCLFLITRASPFFQQFCKFKRLPIALVSQCPT